MEKWVDNKTESIVDVVKVDNVQKILCSLRLDHEILVVDPEDYMVILNTDDWKLLDLNTLCDNYDKKET